MVKNIIHVDEKVLKPGDSHTENLSELSPETIGKHYAKPVRGFAIISDPDTGEIFDTPNLVLLGGREFLAQKLADVSSLSLQPESTDDLTKFKIRYFGVGIGGADTADQPNKVGPFDNDTDLRIAGKFADESSDSDASKNLSYKDRFQYIHNGRLKKIRSDGGEIEIVEEDHIIVKNGNSINVPAYTTVKYSMIIRADELYKESTGATDSGPFAFNEAVLYSVEHEDVPISENGAEELFDLPKAFEGTRYRPKHRAFAKFTTLTKWLEVNDSLRIEWFILV